MAARPAAGGGRWVDVDPARLGRWLDGFEARHAGVATTSAGGPARAPAGTSAGSSEDTAGGSVASLVLVATDGATAEIFAPPGEVGPFPDTSSRDLAVVLDQVIEQVRRPRRLGLLLARQSAVAVGVAEGDTLLVSKVDTSYVQGRTAAGGWSQHRFARRRENQAKAAAGDAADIAVRLLLPRTATLAAVVAGGDRRAVEAILADPRLAPVRALRDERFLEVPEPRLAVLKEAVASARAVRILVRDPVG